MKVKFIFAVALMSAAFCFAQEKSPAFTLEDVQVMATYYSKASIPARSDSATLAAVQTLRAKLNIAMGTKSAAAFVLTDQEKSLVTFMLGDDVAAARRVLVLNSKLITPPAVGKKDTSGSKEIAKK